MLDEFKQSYLGFRIDETSLNRFRSLCKAKNLEVSVALRNFISACLADETVLSQDLSSDMLLYSTFYIVLENAKAIGSMLPMLMSIGAQFSQTMPKFDQMKKKLDEARKRLDEEIEFIDQLQEIVRNRMELLKTAGKSDEKGARP